MDEPIPDPNLGASPRNPIRQPIPGPLFKRVWLIMLALILIFLAVIIAYQFLG